MGKAEAAEYSIQVGNRDTMQGMSDIENTTPEVPVESTELPVEPAVNKSAVNRRRPSPGGQSVSGLDTDPVLLSSVVFKNAVARKSLSVHHVQRRLTELGYRDAYTDKDGWYGDLTMKAVAEYQRDNGLAGDGIVDAATLEHLFSDDPNVTLV